MNFENLGSAQFIALKTFRRNGEGIITPVWVAAEGGKLYIWTRENSGKVKRIRNNSRVRISQCDVRGNPESEWLKANARVLDHPTDEHIQRLRLEAKYGDKYRALVAGESQKDRVVLEIQGAE